MNKDLLADLERNDSGSFFMRLDGGVDLILTVYLEQIW
jgi:hypothetical protein